MFKERFDYCPKKHYYNKLIEQKLKKELLKRIKLLKKESLKQIKNVNRFEDLLNIHIRLPEVDLNQKLEMIEIQECNFIPSNCKLSYQIVRKNVESLQVELNKELGILNSIAEVIEHLKELHQEKGLPKDVYFKIYFDRDDHMTCVYFDLSGYDSDKMATLYLSFGKTPMNYRSRMYLKYDNDGELQIVDFFSIIENKGHGTFMLKSLVDLIPLLNPKIEQENQELFNELSISWDEFQNTFSFKEPIHEVKGSIYSPPDASPQFYERLVRFYKRNGFYDKGSVYRRVSYNLDPD
ncbi:hypothetical protein [Paenibacillus polymyxa]|nr:hypothetical protein [Paenibacillus polymyxa]MBY7740149.1 hypothetical protein [Paenibacillus polymyxa]